jgi:hypothetical protein
MRVSEVEQALLRLFLAEPEWPVLALELPERLEVALDVGDSQSPTEVQPVFEAIVASAVKFVRRTLRDALAVRR